MKKYKFITQYTLYKYYNTCLNPTRSYKMEQNFQSQKGKLCLLKIYYFD